MKKANALVVISALGSIRQRKKEQSLFVHPLRDLVKGAERNLVDERKGKEKVRKVVDAQGLNLNPLQSLNEAHRLQVRKTGKPAENTFLEPALVEPSAISGIHRYVETGVQEAALMTKSAHSYTRKSLSKDAAQPLLRQRPRQSRNRKLKPKVKWPS